MKSLLLLLLSSALFSSCQQQSHLSNGFVHALSIQFQKATPEQVKMAQGLLFRQAMNPLSISTETLLVAVEKQEQEQESLNNDNDNLLGFGQIRPLNNNNDDEYNYYELASLFVLPSHRRQGIGSSLVQELLKRHDENQMFLSKRKSRICLLTLKPTVPFYEPFGFSVMTTQLENLPSTLQLEYKAGSIISAVLGNDIVCMIR